MRALTSSTLSKKIVESVSNNRRGLAGGGGRPDGPPDVDGPPRNWADDTVLKETHVSKKDGHKTHKNSSQLVPKS